MHNSFKSERIEWEFSASGGKKEKTRELSAQRTPDNVFVREWVLLRLEQITTAGKSFRIRFMGKGQNRENKTHCAGEASPIFLMDERDYSSWVLYDDGERKSKEMRDASEVERRDR